MAKKKKKNHKIRKNHNYKKTYKQTSKKGVLHYFSPESDIEFKEAHPIGYVFLVALAIFALILPVALYLIFVLPYDINSPWLMLGWVGSFVIGIGLFNFVAIIIKQYLGLGVSILSFLIGSILILISLEQMGIM